MFAKTVLFTRSSKQPVSDRNIARREKGCSNSMKNSFEKQPPEVFYKKVFCKIHRKTPVLESLF